MIVIDASALLEVLVGTPAKQIVGERIEESGSLHAPYLIDIEAAQVIRRLAIANRIAPEHGQMALERLVNLRLSRHPHDHLLSRVWELRNNLAAYDAIYVALAEFLNAPLLTRDRRMANAAGHRARIELV